MSRSPRAPGREWGLCRYLLNRQEMGDVQQNFDPRNPGVPWGHVVSVLRWSECREDPVRVFCPLPPPHGGMG